MSKERYIFKRKDLRKLFKVFLALSVIFTLFSPWLKTTQHIARAVNDDLIHNIRSLGDDVTVSQKGCDIVVKKKDKTHWAVPRKPIDLVILQDASGSFDKTIGNVKSALSQLTTPVDAINYDPDKPRLVFTGDPDTTDRVMVASFQDLDGYRLYDKQQQPSASSYVDTSGRNYDPEKGTWYYYSGNNIYWWDNSINNWVTKYETDTNFTGDYREGTWDGSKYTLNSSDLTNDKTAIDNFINSIQTNGGTPTVPAIEDIIDKYNSVKGNMNNDRKTVFLLITDGVANGVRKDGKVVIEYSGKRSDKLLEKYGLNPLEYQQMEGSSNILARADELTKVGAKLKQAVGEKGSVVVGFWEDLNKLTTYGQYYNIYDNGFRDTGINFGDNRSVREIFSTALRSLASPDKVINGKNATFYVNEQNDIQAFSDKVLASVGNALIKENVQGDFTVTEGYRVKSVSINHKKVVDKETIDKEHEIRGTIKQDGNKVTISVPDAAFNPGENKFDYELVNTVEQPNLSEDDEVAPTDDYTPTTEDKKVGELVGHFHVGKYKTDLIGSKEERTVKVNSLKYCYPNVKKSIEDKNTANDKVNINDPILDGKKAYGAVLDDVREEFDYTVDYRMNHIPLNFEKNAMLIDPIDYRLDVIDAYVTETGSTQKLTNFTIRKVNETDSVTNKERTVVVADIPQKPGTKTDSVDEGNYGGHKFKKYTLHVKVKIKDEYPYEKSQKDYIKILQENDGYGLRNQASIKWNGETDNPNDDTAQVRRSNNVFVVPPVKTDIDKKVRGERETVDQGREHYYLPQRYDKFIYDIKSSWPGLMDSYSIEDQLEPELEVNKADIKVMVNNTEIKELKNHITVENNLVKLSLEKSDITPKLNRAIQRANKDNNGPAQIHIEIKAKIKEGANVDKFKDDNGVIKVPNKATVKLNNQPIQSQTVYVTPDEPAVTKKINNTLDHLNIPSWDKQDNAYNYNIKTTLPGNINDYNIYRIEDVLDQDLELQEGKNPIIKGEVAEHFDVSYDSTTRTVTAKVKDGHFNQLTGKSIIELEIPAKIKDGISREKIPNIAKVFYNTTNATGEPKKLETPPVTVTPPPSAPTKKINETLDDLVINSASENAYNYNIKSKLPGNIAEYKQYGIKDKLDDRLELQEGKQASIKGGNAEHFDVIYDKSTNTVVAKVKEGHFENLKGVAEVELVIPAKIKDGVTEKKIPNEATVIFNQTDANGEPKETPKTPPVTVTPPPPSEPPITKTVNDKTHEDLTSLTQEFVYKIETQVPKHATAFEVTDTIKDVLEFKGAADVEATVDGETITDVKTEGKKLTVKLSEEQVKNKAGKNVVVKFTAKLKADITAEELKEFTTADVVKVPNTAKYKINLSDEPKFNKESEPVTVTPPKPNEPGITKKVNNQDHVNLTDQEEVFTYKIETTVPTNATAFSITDTLVDELEFGNNGTPVSAKVENDFIENSNITIKGQTLTVKLSDKQVRTKGGKAVVVEFVAKVKQGANISKYTEKKVPNKATYHIDNKFNKDSNTVTVTPPPSKPEISKKVNEANHYDLPNRNDEFTYTITTQMPNNANIFEITDELKEVLQFVGEKGNAVVKIEGKDAGNKATININGQKLLVSFTEESVKGDAGKVIEVTFKAKIREGANLSNYITGDKTQVPNKASYDINNDPKYHKDSNVVPVTPPTPGEPEIIKDVNGKASETLQNRNEEFTYNVTTKVPEDATAFEVHDTIEGVLEFSGDKGGAKATLNGKDLAAERITVDGQTIKVTLTEDEVKANGGKEVKLSFKAKIREGANLSGYVKEDKVQVPNKAQYRVDLPNKPGVTKDSNVVPVTPPTPGEPEIIKDVNGKASETLQNRNEEFTYNVTTKVPEDATAFEVHDTIEGVLEFSGDKGGAKATLNGKDLAAERITVDGQTIKVTLTEDEVKANGGKEVKLSFKAKIREGANLSGYVKEDKVQVPNKAQYRVDLPNKPGVTKDSNVVPVTPPTPGEPEIIKDVNGKASETLQNRNEEFTYNVTTKVPEDATAFEVHDTIEGVLEFSGDKGGAKATLNGKDLAAERITVDGQTIKVTLTEDEVKANGGKEVKLSFKAKIREGANLSGYVKEDKVQVPNKAQYRVDLPNKPGVTKDSNVVPVTPPTPGEPEIIKDVNGKASETLQNRNEEFTYNVTTKVPEDATAFEVHDTIEGVLEFSGDKGGAKATLNGKDLAAERITVDGQTIKVTLTEDEVKANGGKEVKLSFKAKIREGANLSGYVKEDKVQVPNKAQYRVDLPNKPGVTKDSNVVPVTPPTPGEPEIIKDVNGKASETLQNRNEEFTYNVTTKVPEDATAFEVHDTIEGVLEFSGDKGGAKATLNGKDLAAERITVDGQTIKVTLTEDEVKANGGKEVKLSFKAKIREGANLSGYVKEDKVQVPNKAQYRVDLPNKPGVTKDSNVVPVTPPTPGEPEIIKDVNGKASETLQNRNEEFTYNVTTKVPEDATAFEVHDTIEGVLEFSGEKGGAKATLNGKDLAAERITVDGQTIKVTLTEDEVKANGGKEVKLSFKAKIREGANLSGYVKEDKVQVPNKAQYRVDLPNKPGVTKDSNVVPVTPPTPGEPEIIKDVNGKASETLQNRNEEFTYNVTTKVPEDATAFEVHDTIEGVLEFSGDKGGAKATLNGKDLAAERITVDGQTIKVTLTEDEVKANGGKEVKLSFKAKIREGANLSGYVKEDKVQVPNKAQYRVDLPNKPGVTKDSNVVPVTPPTPGEPEIIKDVNGKASETLQNRNEEFTYNVTTKVPEDATAFEVHDTIEGVLEFSGDKGGAKATLNGKDLAAERITVDGQTIKVTLTEDEVKANGGKEVKLSFKAKIREGANLSGYVKEDKVQVPNKAQYRVDLPNKPGVTKDSNVVPVTPPTPGEPEIIKDVNGKASETLQNRNEEFTYNVTTKVPEDATAFEVHDTIEGVLEFSGEKGGAKATLNGKDLAAERITVDGQTIKVTLTEDEVKANGGKEVKLSFKAKIREGANLSGYVKEDKVQVPNKAQYRVDLPNKPGVTKDSNVVPVTPPTPGEPEIIKDVNGKASETLQNRNEEFTYNVTTKVPEDATAFEVHDTIEGVLEFSGDKGGAKATLNGKDLAAERITVDGQTIKVTLTEDEVKANGGKEVKLSFKAKIREGANLSGYVKEDKVQVPNKAQYRVDLPNKPGVTKDSNVVPVTPPTPGEPEIIKDVNGKASETLQNRNEEFTYNVTTKVPEDATAFEVHDTIEGVLEFSGDKGGAKATLNGKDLAAERITVDGQTIKVTLTEDEVKANGGKEVKLSFKAKIREGANLSGYVKEDKVQVPNKAQYRVDLPNKPGVTKDSNVVPVTPPTPGEPEIIKDVNGKASETLQNRNEEFTYNVTTKVPEDATAFEVHDTIEGVLEFSGDKGGAKATLNGKDLAAERITVDGQTIKVTLTEDEVKANGGKEVKLSFKAKIREGANLSGYVKEDKVQVPNKAQYRVDLPNKPGVTKDSNVVPVTPPTPGEPEIIKDVNGKASETLQNRNEEFTYNVTTKVPEDATAFEVHDTIEGVLEFSGEKGGAKATLNGKDLAAERITVDGQTIKVTLTEDEVKANGGKEVKLSFKAKIREGANLSGYVKEDKVQVPNKAQYRVDLPNKPGVTKDSNVVPVTPPTPGEPEIIKDVNGKASETLQNRNEEFTYNVTTKVPEDATAFEVHDTIEGVLEFSGDKGGAKATLNGKDLAAERITVDGQTIKVTLTEDEVKANGGKEVKLSFKAKIREGANLSGYVKEDKVQVPNKAQYRVDLPNKPGVTKDSNVVPVTPPTPGEPEIIKDVNGKASETLQNRNEEFTYNVTTKVPEDATAFEVHDTIEGVLEFSGEKGGAKATLNGKDLAAERITVDGQTIKVTLTEDEVKANGGKEVKLSFKAKIREGANLSGYVKEDKVQVPNKAQYRVDLPNKPGVTKDSNVVPVTPPPSEPTKPNIVKTVNNKQQQVLRKIDEEFVYRISTTMPENAEQFNILDKLESVLEFSGKAEVRVNGKKVDAQITQDNGELNVEFKGDFVKQNGGKSIDIEFKAKITKDADLSRYEDLGYAVPNEARYIVNNNPKITGKTPPVFVTPPPTKIVPPKPGKKSINSENGEENETLRELKVNNEVFRYDIKERLGINQDYKQFAISDDLEKVLDILKAEIRIDGEKIDTIAVDKELAKLNDELAKVQNKLQQVEGKSTVSKDESNLEVRLLGKKQQLETVKAKLKSEKTKEKVVELNKEQALLEKDIAILTGKLSEKQNTAKNTSVDKEKLEKAVHDLQKQIKDYKESDKIKAIELLNNALSTRNDKNTIDKEALKKIGDLVIRDNTVVFEVTNKDILRLLEGREVTLSIYAKIKDNADLSKYKDGNVINVPNEAKIIFDHKPKTTNKVYVVPKPKNPTPPPGEVPPTPEIPKEPKPKKPIPKTPTTPTPKTPNPTPKVEKPLVKTGSTTTSTGWLGVLGLIALLFVRRNRKDK